MTRKKKAPIHKQIEDDIRAKVLSGELKPGDKLTGIRDKGNEMGVHYHTVRQAYNNLRAEGILSSVRSQGTIVLDQGEQISRVLVIIPSEGMSVSTQIVRGIRSVFEKNDVETEVFDTATDPALEMKALEQIDGSKFTGAIILSEMTEDLDAAIQDIIRSGIPVVMLDRFYASFSSWNVASDNFRGGHLATSHLVERGCKRIAMVCYGDYSTTNNRYEGYCKALADNGREVNPDLVKQIAFKDLDKPAATEALLDMDNPPDGIFYFNDFQAMKGMQAILSRGLKIPDDIAVVGFDDVEAAALCHPQLTTIRQNGAGLGKRAAELWIEQSGMSVAKRRAGRTELVDVELVERATA